MSMDMEPGVLILQLNAETFHDQPGQGSRGTDALARQIIAEFCLHELFRQMIELRIRVFIASDE